LDCGGLLAGNDNGGSVVHRFFRGLRGDREQTDTAERKESG
jgi:hypothetical protein